MPLPFVREEEALFIYSILTPLVPTTMGKALERQKEEQKSPYRYVFLQQHRFPKLIKLLRSSDPTNKKKEKKTEETILFFFVPFA